MSYSQTYLNGNTDLQLALQNIKEDGPRPRRSGRTYSTLLYMLGQAIYGKYCSNYLYIGESNGGVDEVKYGFINILDARGVIANHYGFVRVPSTDQRFMFATDKKWVDVTRGFTIENAFVDLSGIHMYNLDLVLLQKVCKNIYYG